MKMEWYRLFQTKRSRLIILLLFLLPIIDLLLNMLGPLYQFWVNKEEVARAYISHPTFASFLSASSEGHFGQMLYFWILPVILLLLYDDFHIQEKKLGYRHILYTKISKRKFFTIRLRIAFLLPFALVFSSLLVNFGLASLIFQQGTYFGGMEEYKDVSSKLFQLSLESPYMTYFLYICTTAVFVGVFSMFCISIVYLFPLYKQTFLLTFLAWVILNIGDYSIMYAFQPFTEYGMDRIIPSILLLFTLTALSLLAMYFYRLKQDEI